MCLSASASCQFPQVFYSFLQAVRCKQLTFKNIPQRQPLCANLTALLSMCDTFRTVLAEACFEFNSGIHLSPQAMTSSRHPPATECCTSPERRGTTTRAASSSIASVKRTRLLCHRYSRENRWVLSVTSICHKSLKLIKSL